MIRSQPRSELTRIVELEEQIKSLTESLKTERQRRREGEIKLTQLDEDISEIRDNNTALNKV